MMVVGGGELHPKKDMISCWLHVFNVEQCGGKIYLVGLNEEFEMIISSVCNKEIDDVCAFRDSPVGQHHEALLLMFLDI